MQIATIWEVPAELSISSTFLELLQESLKKTNMVISFLKPNDAVLDLHQLWMNKDPNLDRKFLPKPLALKKKSSFDGFFYVSPNEVQDLNEHLEVPHSKFDLVDHSYPLTHLGHLIKIGRVKTLLKDDFLFITDNEGKFLYKCKLPDNFPIEKISDVNYLINGKEKFSYLKFLDEEGLPIKVLGFQGPFTNNQPWPVFSDLDPHSASKQTKKNSNNNNNNIMEKIFDTGNDKDWAELYELLEAEINKDSSPLNLLEKELQKDLDKTLSENSPVFKLTPNVMINRYMGKIRVSEAVAFFLFNASLKKYHPFLNVIPHGSTLNLSQADAIKVNANIKAALPTGVTTNFPQIDEQTVIGAIFPSGKVVVCKGKEVLLLYKILNEHGYDFPISDWPDLFHMDEEEISYRTSRMMGQLYQQEVILPNDRIISEESAKKNGKEEISDDESEKEKLLVNQSFFKTKTQKESAETETEQEETARTNNCKCCVLV